MKINWRIRFLNPNFWATFVPAVALLVQSVATLFGYSIDLTTVTGQVLAVVDAAFGVLAILGVVTDHTTEGFGDSNRALSYDHPWDDDEYWSEK